MSKAFTSEENEDEGAFEAPALPPGVKNYMTLAGVDRMRRELERLDQDRRQLKGATVETQAQLAKIERRVRFLADRLETAVPIDPLKQPANQVAFGASVTVRPAAGKPQTWRIVGIDEADVARNWISWMAPLASALLGKQPGETFTFRNQSQKIEKLTYEA